MQTPFVIYAEFKPNLKEVQKPNKDNSDVSYTDKYQNHIACSYEYKAVRVDKKDSYSTFKGEKIRSLELQIRSLSLFQYYRIKF